MTADDRDFGESLGVELVNAVSRLRRVTLRVLRQGPELEQLTAAEGQLLLTVVEEPGIGVAKAAHALGLAPNTVSTLVGSLTRAGFVERTPSPGDRRSAMLHPTARGLRYMADWRERRYRVMTEALARLPADDVRRIRDAVTSLDRLTDAIASAPDASGSGT